MAPHPVPRLVAVAVVALVTAGCAGTGTAGVPDRAPDVTGVVARADAPGGPVLADPSDGYFEGMALLGGDPLVVGDDGGPLDPAALRDGDGVEVWIGDGCAESFPVQCDVTAVRVRP